MCLVRVFNIYIESVKWGTYDDIRLYIPHIKISNEEGNIRGGGGEKLSSKVDKIYGSDIIKSIY